MERLATGGFPLYLTSFIGRHQDVVEVRHLLRDRRLLTLTGAGGTGKTRLAVEVVTGLQAEFPDGVWMIELADLTDPALLPHVVGSAVGLHQDSGRPAADALVSFLRDRRALLLLDNCEQLVDACAALTAALLQACPELRVLTTSREALGVPGECVRPMLPLALPADATPDAVELAGVEAVALFLDRARLLAPDFRLTAANVGAVARICRLLDGIPLAIELAAARVPVLDVAQIAEYLDTTLRVLAIGPRGVAPRHQTMRAAIDWSHELLAPTERLLWYRLSVFRSGFSLAAAEAVCADESTMRSASPALQRSDILDHLASLASKSMVMVTRGDDEARYRLLEPMRQYAAEQLEAIGETVLMHTRLCDWALAWAEQHEAKLRGPDQAVWRRFETEYGNLQAALSWQHDRAQDAEPALRLIIAVAPFWAFRDRFAEGRHWIGKVLSRFSPAAPTAARAKVLFFASVLAWYQGDHAEARTYIEESHAAALALQDEGQWGLPYTLMMLGQVVRFQGEEQRALRHLQESVDRFRRDGDRWGLAVGLSSLGSVARQLGDMVGARAAFEESRTIWRAVGDPWGMALNELEFVLQAVAEDDEAAALAVYEESSATLAAMGYTWHLAMMRSALGTAALRRGDGAAAAGHYREMLTLTRQIGHEIGEAVALAGLGAVALGQGRLAEAAAQCLAAVARLEQLRRPAEAAACLEKLAHVAGRAGYASAATGLQAAAATLREAAPTWPPSAADQTAAFAAAQAELRHLPLAVRPALTATSSFDLTPREIDVLRLLAQGLTDAQIAAQLVVSRRTVNAHLRSIYSKLGVSSRTAAARLALEQHLV